MILNTLSDYLENNTIIHDTCLLSYEKESNVH